MLAEQRRSMILKTLKARATGVSVVELGELLQVSTMTIRRDLELLEGQHQVRRIHGGATVLQEDTGEPFLLRSTTASLEKASIGILAASLVDDNDVILLDAGTTTLALASRLPRDISLTVITHALPIAQALCAYENIKTVFLGGMLKRKEQCAVGPLVLQALARFNADKFFLSATGFDLERGPSDPDLLEVEIKQAMIRAANRVILLVDSTKSGQVHLVQIASWSSIHTMVSDQHFSQTGRDQLTALGVQVMV
jgi:DeoR family transcriptional regulator, fructose operon transcriptional repressor